MFNIPLEEPALFERLKSGEAITVVKEDISLPSDCFGAVLTNEESTHVIPIICKKSI